MTYTNYMQNHVHQNIKSCLHYIFLYITYVGTYIIYMYITYMHNNNYIIYSNLWKFVYRFDFYKNTSKCTKVAEMIVPVHICMNIWLPATFHIHGKWYNYSNLGPCAWLSYSCPIFTNLYKVNSNSPCVKNFVCYFCCVKTCDLSSLEA